jgi:hypothetical protein
MRWRIFVIELELCASHYVFLAPLNIPESSYDIFESSYDIFESSYDIFESSYDIFESSYDIFESSYDIFEPTDGKHSSNSEF